MSKIKNIFCAVFRHSDITDVWFGYHQCGRCNQRLGDSLAGVYFNPREVIIEHNCKTCRANYKNLTWVDKFLVKNPFKVSND